MRWSMLPVSICVHVLAGLGFLIVPLAAVDEWPAPAPLHPLAVAMKAVPVEPAVRAPAPARRPAPVNVTAPSAISPERETPDAPSGSIPPDAPIAGTGPAIDGVPNGIGMPAAIVPPPPPPPAGPPVPLRPGQGIREPRKIVDVRPIYPTLARTLRIEGVVILEAVINERGGVERLKVLRSVPLLDAAAVDAVKEWRYSPTLLNGVPVPVLMTITVNFTLRD